MPNYQSSSTLYVNNLPPDATERVSTPLPLHRTKSVFFFFFFLLQLILMCQQELTNFFRFIPNFVQVRMIHKEGKNSFCFVDFRDPDSAYVARSLLQVSPYKCVCSTMSGIIYCEYIGPSNNYLFYRAIEWIHDQAYTSNTTKAANRNLIDKPQCYIYIYNMLV